jgi:hypothetical protein
MEQILTPRERAREIFEHWGHNKLVPVPTEVLRELLEGPPSDLILCSLYETARGWTGTREEFVKIARELSVGRIPL